MLPNPADLSALSRLLDEALDLDPAQIERWLDALPAAQAHLRPRLRSMLALHESHSDADFLTELPTLDELATPADDMAAKADDLVGPYRLIREIGRGGMGAVWLAERADGSFKRQIALKLPRLAWGANLAERMARERDIGALLEHPHIARLYDAGLDALGRPYLAMEYIDGQPLDAWCATHALSVAERLRLFLQVARAVAYAHGRLVVHRDLKPSNILVTSDAQAHLLDFGIAKLLDEAAPYDKHLTQEGRVLTPHYASPEQVRGENITVASDVYSLGVLLYELLTGQFPHAPRRKSVAALEEAILDTEPDIASSRTQNRTTAKALRGDIDAILTKAMKREPRQRYATADAFADDIERYLNGETVQAQPDSLHYRLTKTLLRHRLLFTAGAVVLAAVIGGTGVSIVQAKRANDAAERARVVKEFVVDIFKVNSLGSASNAELRKLPAEMLIEHGAQMIETRFAGQMHMQAELFGVVGRIFMDMGAPQLATQYAGKQIASLASINAGQTDQAKAMLLLAQALYDQKHYRDADIHVRRAIAMAQDDYSLLMRARMLFAQNMLIQGQTTEALGESQAIENELQQKITEPNIVRANAMYLRANQMSRTNRFNEAMPIMNAAINEAIAAEGPLSRTAIDIRLRLAASLIFRSRAEEARPYREAALSALRSLGGASEIRAALEESNLIFFRFAMDQITFEEAKTTIERSKTYIEGKGKLVPTSILALIDMNLGSCYDHWGEVAQGDRLISAAVAVLRPTAVAPMERFQLADTLGPISMTVGRHEQADELLRERIEMRKQFGGAQSPFAVWDFITLAMNLNVQRRFNEAIQVLDTAPKYDVERGDAAGGRYVYVSSSARARIALDSGDAVTTLTLMADAKDPDEADPPTLTSRPLLVGEAMCANNQHTEGLSLLQKVIAQGDSKRYQHEPLLARTRAMAGLCALTSGQRKLAQQYASQAREAFVVQPGVSPYFKIPSERLDKLLNATIARR